MRHLLALLALLCLPLAGCPTTAVDDDDDDSAMGDDDDAQLEAPLTVEPGHVWEANGEATWTLFFGDGSSCTYTRTWSGALVTDRPWQQATADLMFRGDATMTEGFADCAEPVFGGTEVREEVWGVALGDDSAEGSFIRRTGNGALTVPTGPIQGVLEPGVPFDISWNNDAIVLGNGTTLALEARGSMTISWVEEELPPSPFAPRSEPYACGWPTNNPGDLMWSRVLEQDTVLPPALLEDACGERVNIHDFYGSWVLLDSAQPDCGPCHAMADALPAFVEELAAAGHQLHVVTVLGGGLSASTSSPSDNDYNSWRVSHGEEETLLRDEGYGPALLGGWLADDMAYPAYALFRPDLSFAQAFVGFSQSSLDQIEAIIEDAR